MGGRWAEYVARHFPPHSKAMMDELVANLLAAYRQSISKLDWMTDETKQRAPSKLDTFRPKIGYPKFRDYSRLQVTTTTCSATWRPRRRSRPTGSWRNRGAVDRDEWFMLPQTVNAYYNPAPTRSASPPGSCRSRSSPGGRGGRELRRHRRGDRPRDRSRVRRPGRAVRRRRQSPRLVDARRQGGVEVKSKALIEQYDGFGSRATSPASGSTARSPSARTSATSAG